MNIINYQNNFQEKIQNKSQIYRYVLNDYQDTQILNIPNKLFEFADLRKLTPLRKDNLAVYDFLYIDMFSENDAILHPREMMDAWNLFDDICESLQISNGLFKKLSDNNRSLHQKLVFQSDVFSECTRPIHGWEANTFSTLKELMSEGLKLFYSVNKKQ